MRETTPIGLIGIGQLGLAIAEVLLKAGYRVLGYRRSAMDEFIKLGGSAASSVIEVAKQCPTILLCLPNEEASRSVLERDGLLEQLTVQHTLIELGSYPKAFKIEQAKTIENKGARALEVEVSGSPPMVTAHKAALYVGGDLRVFEQHETLLTAISPQVHYLGGYGSALSMKLIANYLLTIHTLAAAEAMHMGEKAGFDPQLLARVLAQGAGGSAMFSVRAPLMAERKFSPAPGPFKTLEKYLDMGEELSEELGCSSPLFTASLPYFRKAIASGMGEEDIAAVIKLLEQESRQT